MRIGALIPSYPNLVVSAAVLKSSFLLNYAVRISNNSIKQLYISDDSMKEKPRQSVRGKEKKDRNERTSYPGFFAFIGEGSPGGKGDKN